MTPDNSHHSIPDKRYQVNPFDLSTDLFSAFSNQVIHLVMYLDGPVRFDFLEKAVERASQGEPISRCRIIREQDTLFWQEYSAFRAADHVLRLSSRNPGDVLYQALSSPLDPYQGNLFQVILIENTSKTGDILVINAHHIVMDARGLKDFTCVIMRCYTGYLVGNLTEIPETPIKSRQLPQLSLIDKTRPMKTQKASVGWCSPISVPLQSLQAKRFRYSLLTFGPDRTAIIQNTRKTWGITVNDFMIGVLARAITYVLQVKSDTIVPLYTTIDLRRFLPNTPKRSLVNFSTSFEILIPIIPDESLEDTGKRVHDLMNQKKSENPGLDEAIEAEKVFDSGYSAAWDLMNTAWTNILNARNKTTIFSNTGIISCDQFTSNDLSVRNAFFLPGFFQPPGFFFLLSTFEDMMTVSASYAIPAYDPDLVNRMFYYIDSIIPGFHKVPGEYQILG